MNLARTIRIAALLAALLSAFVMIPGIDIVFVAIGLALGFLAVDKIQRTDFLIAAVALNLVAEALAPVPVAGLYLTALLLNLGAILSAAAVAVILTILKEWVLD